ncbi:MAG: hypothetical protein OSJ62_07645 [Lachnospiraceae bacterium]|nr:hypothetical protein [Lachnospiraceae bacterium]
MFRFPELKGNSIPEKTIKRLVCLYSIVEGTQPLDREFGLNGNLLDLPPEVAKNRYTLDVIQKTEKYIREVRVKEVTFIMNPDGSILPTIHLKLIEE